MECPRQNQQPLSQAPGFCWSPQATQLELYLKAYRCKPQFRAAKGKKKLVEHRKLIKHYLDFIKSSQRFYRGYIQRLDSHFDGIPELRAVARKLNLDGILGLIADHEYRADYHQ